MFDFYGGGDEVSLLYFLSCLSKTAKHFLDSLFLQCLKCFRRIFQNIIYMLGSDGKSDCIWLNTLF